MAFMEWNQMTDSAKPNGRMRQPWRRSRPIIHAASTRMTLQAQCNSFISILVVI